MVEVFAALLVFVLVVFPISLVLWLACAMTKAIHLNLLEKELEIKRIREELKEEKDVD